MATSIIDLVPTVGLLDGVADVGTKVTLTKSVATAGMPATITAYMQSIPLGNGIHERTLIISRIIGVTTSAAIYQYCLVALPGGEVLETLYDELSTKTPVYRAGSYTSNECVSGGALANRGPPIIQFNLAAASTDITACRVSFRTYDSKYL